MIVRLFFALLLIASMSLQAVVAQTSKTGRGTQQQKPQRDDDQATDQLLLKRLRI